MNTDGYWMIAAPIVGMLVGCVGLNIYLSRSTGIPINHWYELITGKIFG